MSKKEEKYIDKAIYKYNEETSLFNKLELSNVKKVPVINEEIITNISTFRNMISDKLPHRPELSVLVTMLIQAGLECDVNDTTERIKSFYKDSYG